MNVLNGSDFMLFKVCDLMVFTGCDRMDLRVILFILKDVIYLLEDVILFRGCEFFNRMSYILKRM